MSEIIIINPMVFCPKDKRYVKITKCAGCSDKTAMTNEVVLCRYNSEDR